MHPRVEVETWERQYDSPGSSGLIEMFSLSSNCILLRKIGGQHPWKGGTLLQSFYSGQSKWEIIFLKLFLHVKFLKDTKKHRGLSICRLAIEGQAWAWIRGSFTLSDLRVNASVKLLLPELSLM